jgi:DNA polymerase III alpha subunit
MGVDQKTFEGWIDNSRAWADGFKGFKFKDRKSLPTRFYPEKTLEHTMRLIQKHGRHGLLRDPAYMERLRAEINLLHYNGTIDLLPYFFIDEEVCDLYQSRGLLTGPGRGSAAGLLLAYLLEITHVDPLKYGCRWTAS